MLGIIVGAEIGFDVSAAVEGSVEVSISSQSHGQEIAMIPTNDGDVP